MNGSIEKFLFFDIESSNGNPHQASMCSFGYYLTDKHFNIIEHGDIIISPKTKFSKRLIDNKVYGKRNIKLAYSEKDFLNAPKFPEVYDKIKSLITKGTILIGFDIKNDIQFLNSACLEYKLNKFIFLFFDVMLMQQVIYKDKKIKLSLKNLAQEYNINEFIEHRSDEDARVTMEIFKAMVNNNKIDFNEFLVDNNIKLGFNATKIRNIHLFDSYKLKTNYDIPLHESKKIIIAFKERQERKNKDTISKNAAKVYIYPNVAAKYRDKYAALIIYIINEKKYAFTNNISEADYIYDVNNETYEYIKQKKKETKLNVQFINVDDILLPSVDDDILFRSAVRVLNQCYMYDKTKFNHKQYNQSLF